MDFCADCMGPSDWAATLGHNLTIAAGLCAAYRSGKVSGTRWPHYFDQGEVSDWACDPTWAPGCGRPVRGEVG